VTNWKGWRKRGTLSFETFPRKGEKKAAEELKQDTRTELIQYRAGEAKEQHK